MKIKFLNLKKNYLSIKNEIEVEYDDLFKNCDFINGNKVKIFENNFSNYLNIKHFIGCANGTDALEIAVKSLELEKDDEIIVQGNTYIATCFGVINNNIKLILCDIEPDTHMISINCLKKKITSKTKAIIVVHLYGMMPNMDEIINICKMKNIILIEDCAQAHGATWNGKKAGEFGKIACFSFYPGKNLGAYGDGGGIGTNDDNLNEKIRKISNLGCKIKYHHELVGRNSRLDTIQAGILNVKLKYLDKWNEMRRINSLIYNKHLKDIPEISVQKVINGCIPVYHLYVIKTNKRDELKKYLEEKGIECLIHYPISIAETEAFKDDNYNDISNCISNSKQILSLPMYPELTKEEIEYVCINIKKFFEQKLNKLKSIKTLGKPGTLHCLNEMNFNIKRFFYVDNFNELDKSSTNKKRGLHSNINFDEFMIVLEGQIEIKLIDKNQTESITTLYKDEYIYIPKMNWVEFEILSSNTIIIVLANEIMEKSKSVHNFNEFINY
jgi:dTDP-4-amino-4,6-dideoxygalactose transaminase/mannose-6-phosphate isomerase-like protein (cupin superfamily)